jgi:hypothetical protein
MWAVGLIYGRCDILGEWESQCRCGGIVLVVECSGGAGERPLEVFCQGGGHVECEDLVSPLACIISELLVLLPGTSTVVLYLNYKY